MHQTLMALPISALILISLLHLGPSSVSCGFACLSNPCVHGVCLDDLNSTYFCYCIDGYTGIQCQTNWNECWSDPCQNGGTCIDGIAMFNCSCPPGFLGDLCEEDLNECESNPCQNNGTCVDASNGYTCSCAPGYAGAHCQIDIAVCNATSEARCYNGGVCEEGPGESFTCRCRPGWEGTLCEAEINECRSSPCQNGAICIDLHAGYACACLFGFAGRNCEEIVQVCDQNPCKNGALCLMEEGLPACYCVPDFHGDLCQWQYDECQLGPKCVNGGTCVDGVDKFTCSCPAGLTGSLCECLIVDDALDCSYVAPSTTTTEAGTTTMETIVPNVTTTTSFTTETMWTEVSTKKEVSTRNITDPILITEPILITDTTTSLDYTTILLSSTTISTTTTIGTTNPPTSPAFTAIDNFTATETTESLTTVQVPDSTTVSTTLTTFLTDEPATGTTPTTFDCTRYDTRCQNGGTCIFTDGTYKCLCTWDAEGVHCQIPLGVQTAAFGGHSFLSHELRDHRHVDFQLQAKTLSSSGVIFYVQTEGVYMTLYLEGGYLKFRFSCGYQTMLLSELRVPVNNGYLMTIRAVMDFTKDLRHCDASIKVNNTLTMAGDQVAQVNLLKNPVAWLHLGGLPASPNGFVGCMTNLTIAGRPINLFKDAQDGFAVGECSSLACLHNPCGNGGSCVPSNDSTTWSCHCRNGFLGKKCERSICDDNPCYFGGTCVPFSGSGYICLCPYGKHGHFCENSLQISEPYFSGNIRGLSSYATYPIPEGLVSRQMEVQFKFSPASMEQISLLLFIGQAGFHDYYADHLAVSFVKGYIMLTWNLGGGPRRIFTSKPLAKGARDYQVTVGHLGRRAWLSVANLGNVTGRAPGGLSNLDVVPIMYIGGHQSRNFSQLPHDLPLHSGFAGCIFDLQLRSGNVLVPLRGSTGRAVGQCGTTECYDQSCQNGGACLHHGSTFMCLCQDNWYDPLCTSRENLCESNHTKCSEDSTCVPLIAGYNCDCPYGRTGTYCENKAIPGDLSLSGRRSYIEIQPQDFQDYRVAFSLHLRILDDNGLIFFVGQTSNFLSLYLQSNIIELRANNLLIRSNKLLLKGIWYQVDFGLFGRKVYLTIDGVVVTGIAAPGTLLTISKRPIYLGGLPDLSRLPLTAAPNHPVPLTGCLRHLHLNSLHLPLNAQTIVSTRNLIDCDGTPCSGQTCLNGGTCWLDSFMKPHCSCQQPYHGPKCELIPDCTSSQCQNGGQCHKPRCSCSLGYTGAFCERKISVKTPQFNGRGYLIIRNPTKKRQIKTIGRLYMNFTTWKPDGLLMWTQNLDAHLGVGLENGHLKLIYTNLTGEEHVEIPSIKQIADGLFHTIEITFAPLAMKLDNQTLGENKRNVVVMTDGVFFIGGLPTGNRTLLEATLGTFHEHFEGCLEGFRANNDEIITDFTEYDGSDVGVCDAP